MASSPVLDKVQTKQAALALLVVPLRAYVLMLALGILHLRWSAVIPALGFWECLVLSLVVTALIPRSIKS